MKKRILFTFLFYLLTAVVSGQNSFVSHAKERAGPLIRSSSPPISGRGGGGCVPSPYLPTDSVYLLVIATDTFCCSTQWDRMCQDAYDALVAVNGAGQTCDDARMAVLGNNASDGPSSGGGCVNCTSGAQNADWFWFEVPSAGVLRLSTCGGGEDTRVWVYASSTGDCSTLEPVAGSDDVCEMAPGSPRFASFLELPVCAGTTYFMEWDDAWDPSPFEFLLEFDPVAGADLAIESARFTEYVHMPPTAARLQAGFGYRNRGSVPLTDIKARFTLSRNGHPFSDETDALVSSLPVCGTGNHSRTVDSRAYGPFVAQVSLSADEVEALTGNNVATQAYTVDTVFARDNGTKIGSFGLGTVGVMGQSFFLDEPDTLTSVGFFLGPGITAGTVTRIEVYSADGSGKPGALLGTTAPLLLAETDSSVWITLPLTGGKLPLPAGGFFVGFTEETDSTPVPMGISNGLSTPFRTWINVSANGQGFQNLENFGFGGFTFMLRAHFGSVLFTASLPEVAEATELQIMPNPGAGPVTLAFTGTGRPVRISLWDAAGKLVHNETLTVTGSVRHTIDLSALAQGIYTLRLLSDQQLCTRKLILAR